MFIQYISREIQYYLLFLIFLAFRIEAYPILTNLTVNNNFSKENFYRKEELNSVQHMLRSKNFVSIGGLPGVGKSYLALIYVANFAKEYDIIWIINGENNIKDEYKIFAQAINSFFKQKTIDLNDVNLINSLKEFLRNTNHTWLIIYDNYFSDTNKEIFLPAVNKNKHYILITNNMADINLKELSFNDRVDLFKYISKSNNKIEIINIIQSCKLHGTDDIVQVGIKKKRGHPVVLQNDDKYKCVLGVNSIDNGKIEKIISQLIVEHCDAYLLIKYLSMLSNSAVNINFIKNIYLHIFKNEADFYNNIDILISKNLLYYKDEQNIKLSGKVKSVLFDGILSNKEIKAFKQLYASVMNCLAKDVLLDHKFKSRNEIYDHIYNLIKLGKNIGCFEEVLGLYLKMLDYHVKFDRDINIIKKLLEEIENEIINKNLPTSIVIQYLSKLSNHYFLLGDLDNALILEKKLNKILTSSKKQTPNIEYELIFNKIRLLKIYANLGDLKSCELIDLKELKKNQEDMKLLYLKAHYLETISYIKYLKFDIDGALLDVNAALRLAYNLVGANSSEFNLYYTCAHLFSKKYLYMIENGSAINEIEDIYNKIYSQASKKDDKSVASIRMFYGYFKGVTDNVELGINYIKSSIEIYLNLYKHLSNKNLSIAYTLLGDLYFKNNQFIEAEESYKKGIDVLNKCYKTHYTYDYVRLLEKLIITLKKNCSYSLLKYHYKKYLSIVANLKHVSNKKNLSLIEF